MADAAQTQVVNAFKTRLEEIDDLNVFVDRDDSEPIQPEERPAIVIRTVDVTLDEAMESGNSVQIHAATMDFDFYVDADSDDNITFQHNEMIASAVAKLHEDWTMGLLYQMTPMSVTAAADAVPAAGVAILTLDVRYQTRFDDWTTIVF